MIIKKLKKGYQFNDGKNLYVYDYSDAKLKDLFENYEKFYNLAKRQTKVKNKTKDKIENKKTFIDSLSDDDKQELLKWIKSNI